MIEVNSQVLIGDPEYKVSKFAKEGTGAVVVYDKSSGDDKLLPIYSPNMLVGEEFGKSVAEYKNLIFVSAPQHKCIEHADNTGVVYIIEKPKGNLNKQSFLKPTTIYSPSTQKENAEFGAQMVTNAGMLYVLANGKQSRVSKTGASIITRYVIHHHTASIANEYRIKHVILAFVVTNANNLLFVTKDYQVGIYNVSSKKSKIISAIEKDSQITVTDNVMYHVDSDDVLCKLSYVNEEFKIYTLKVPMKVNEYQKFIGSTITPAYLCYSSVEQKLDFNVDMV